ncbi:MAG: tetraacyldisaccharide 4'-kinase [Cyclobacteriaceae bacterium]|jgi:tetraacyldisaccharide 4'-kinase
MKYIRILFFPFSLLYNQVTSLRNWLYDIRYFKSFEINIPTITVGNLTVGGTGKTPVIEYLIRLFKDHHKIVTLSRGYKRKTTGFHIAGEQDNAKTIGDEPYQYYNKFKNEIGVAVCEDRLYAIPQILSMLPDTDLILLDDAYQHRKIIPSCNILLNDYGRPFYNDYLLPAGNLRESRKNAKRADVVIITKCPEDINNTEIENIHDSIIKYTRKSVPIFFTSTNYDAPIPPLNKKYRFTEKVILVTAIADPGPLVDHISRNFHLIKHFDFNDHHYFSRRELERIISFYKAQNDRDISILFTEKDIMRIIGTELEDILMEYPVFFQPITYKFAQGESEFEDFIRKVLDKTED